MSRRMPLHLLAALALLCGAAPAAFAVSAEAAPGGPAAHVATDPADCDESLLLEEDDGTLTCADEGEPFDDDEEVCDDPYADDDDTSLDDADEAEAVASSRDDGDECGEDAAETGAPVAPTVSSLRASVSGSGSRRRVRVGFRLDRAGDVRLTLERLAAAGARRARCATPARRGRGGRVASGRRGCARGTALPGAVTVTGRRGANTTDLPRRWNGRALAAGTYRLTATPRQRGGVSATTTFALSAKR